MPWGVQCVQGASLWTTQLTQMLQLLPKNVQSALICTSNSWTHCQRNSDLFLVSITHLFNKQLCETLLFHDMFIYSLGCLIESLKAIRIIRQIYWIVGGEEWEELIFGMTIQLNDFVVNIMLGLWLLTLWTKHGSTPKRPSSIFIIDTDTSVSTSYMYTRMIILWLIREQAKYLYWKSSSDSYDKILTAVSPINGNIEWNNVHTVDKRCIDNVLFLHSSNGLDRS